MDKNEIEKVRIDLRVKTFLSMGDAENFQTYEKAIKGANEVLSEFDKTFIK